jgi:hypothetical protein
LFIYHNTKTIFLEQNVAFVKFLLDYEVRRESGKGKSQLIVKTKYSTKRCCMWRQYTYTNPLSV